MSCFGAVLDAAIRMVAITIRLEAIAIRLEAMIVSSAPRKGRVRWSDVRSVEVCEHHLVTSEGDPIL